MSFLVGLALAAIVQPKPSAVIPLSPYLRYQAVVQATVEGHPGTFMFDTGEGVTSITPAFAGIIGCRPWGRISGFRMTGERLNNPRCDNVAFEMAGQRYVAPIASTLDIMALLGPGIPTIQGSIGLDVFAKRIITIEPRRAVIVETPKSLAARIRKAHPIQIRIVRDVEGIALSVDTAVQTPSGLAWFELDTGNGGSFVVADHIAPLLGFPTDLSTPTTETFYLAGGIPATGMTRTLDLIMDGNIGAQFLNHWNLTLDLLNERAWLSPAA